MRPLSLIIFLFSKSGSGKSYTVRSNKRTNRKSTTSVEVHGDCCMHVVARTSNETEKTLVLKNDKYENPYSFAEDSLYLLTIEIKEC